MQRITPCLWIQNGAEEAAQAYLSAFKNSRRKTTTHYDAAGAEVSGMKKGSVLTIELELAGSDILILNGGPFFTHTPAVSLFVTCGSRKELDSIHEKLSPGGKTLFELGEYPFSPRYTFFSDRFGVHWQLILDEGAKLSIMPSIIFGGDRQGMGPEAMKFYLSLFKDSRVLMDERYPKEGPGKPGSILHARIAVDGSQLAIMDAGHSAPLEMTGALSLIVNCKDQKEVDCFWDAIAKQGKEVQCGWIEDQFGLSWQIVPVQIHQYLHGPDEKKSERAMRAMLKMKKLDLERVRQAYSLGAQ